MATKKLNTGDGLLSIYRKLNKELKKYQRFLTDEVGRKLGTLNYSGCMPTVYQETNPEEEEKYRDKIEAIDSLIEKTLDELEALLVGINILNAKAELYSPNEESHCLHQICMLRRVNDFDELPTYVEDYADVLDELTDFCEAVRHCIEAYSDSLDEKNEFDDYFYSMRDDQVVLELTYNGKNVLLNNIPIYTSSFDSDQDNLLIKAIEKKQNKIDDPAHSLKNVITKMGFCSLQLQKLFFQYSGDKLIANTTATKRQLCDCGLTLREVLAYFKNRQNQ